ncbi:SDR family oxidoreductase [Aspergillus mulundensis]|uniref:PRISE-like Rossmann-fold domain-containing protein n=1 Tax=Aspergillus mulundensis TaxID=1810919 RepID=A0A3D8RKZ2_9EURO|nr:Uncharacterized protein DSM5745_07278 [Aspergillus mulundensis]RDW74616.1 Uncharacterized protein DSM5745_07278 [Aspergillus mulundensis]
MDATTLTAPPPKGKVALVTGANGISGHAIVEYLIRTPKNEWSEIIVTSRKPPHNFWVDPRVRFISLDFLEAPEAIVSKIQSLCKSVTHAFFTSYIHNNDPSKLVETNGPLFRNFFEAIDAACPRLERVSLQTGGKHYGIQFRCFDTPCHEDTPRYDGPGKETLFYYKQEDDLFAIQKRRNTWAYNIIRPFGIVGYTPQFAGMNEALPLAQYFLICRELNEPPQYPGNYNGFHQVEMQSYAPSIADLTVWAATQAHTQNEAFNHGNGDPMAWRFLWTLFGEYFGVCVTGCEPGVCSGKARLSLAEWARDKKGVWERITARYGAGSGEAFQEHSFALMDGLLSRPVPGAQFVASVAKARRFGWRGCVDSYEAWVDTFRSYENAAVLPRREAYME